MDKLIKFNKDSISKKTIDKIAFVFDSHPEFSYEYVKKNSIAVANLFNWVSSILKYHQLISSKIIEEPVKEETKEMIDVEKVEKVEKEEKVEKTEKVEKGKEEERNLNLAESKKMNDEFEKPFLEASKSALNSINKTDLNELKNFNHPPTLVLKTMILVRMLLENNTNIVKKL